MKIVVVGIGYVGLANAVLFASSHEVVILDISNEKVEMINNQKSPIRDELIEKQLATPLNLKADLVNLDYYLNADLVIVATPTDYNPELNYFDTTSVDNTIRDVLSVNLNVNIVIKSTVSVGYTKQLSGKYGCKNLYFSPEFLREGKALYDNLHPSRIILGVPNYDGNTLEIHNEIINLYKSLSLDENVKTFVMGSTEAEAVKLFANTYLAMRVAYFNELDTYAETKGLNAEDIISGISLDPRIGDFYNNPSFGYGGYCLPKDTKQLKANFIDIPNEIINATVRANETRKQFVKDRILSKINKDDVVGVYRLTMKTGSDNFRSSSMISIIEQLLENNTKMVIYEPTLQGDFMGIEIINDLNEFKTKSNLIIANRYSEELNDVADKVYTRDIYKRD